MIAELKATFVNPPTICPTRLNGKETGWIEYMICFNCEEATPHNTFTVKNGFYYQCRKCNLEKDVIRNDNA